MSNPTHNFTTDLAEGKFTAYNLWLEERYSAEEVAKEMEITGSSSEPTGSYLAWIIDQKMTHEVIHENGKTTSFSYKDVE